MARPISHALDGLVGLFSPEKALRRAEARARLDGLRQYAAAKPSRLSAGWTSADTTANDEIRSSSQAVRSRVRQLVRDFPYFSRAVTVLESLIVGPGIRLQSRVKGPDGTMDKEIVAAIESAWRRWTPSASACGAMSLHDLERLTVRQLCECGEALFVLRNVERPGRTMSLGLQPIEPDRLSDLGRPEQGHGLEQGIEYETDTGRPVAYHIDDTVAGKTIRVPAERCIHIFDRQRPGQLRGISPFASAIMAASDLGEYLGAEIDGAKMAAKYLAFIETPDMAGFQRARDVQTSATTGMGEDTLANAVLEYLQPGEKINLASHNRPGNNFESFVRLVLRMVATATGVPYELLSGDYTGINYSTMRVSRNDLAAVLRVRQAVIVEQLLRPLYRVWLKEAVLSGTVQLGPIYWSDPAPFERSEWFPPALESIDPLKETKAQVEMVRAGLTSRRELAAARGRDLEELLEEITEDNALVEQAGLKEESLP